MCGSWDVRVGRLTNKLITVHLRCSRVMMVNMVNFQHETALSPGHTCILLLQLLFLFLHTKTLVSYLRWYAEVCFTCRTVPVVEKSIWMHICCRNSLVVCELYKTVLLCFFSSLQWISTRHRCKSVFCTREFLLMYCFDGNQALLIV